MKLCIKDQKILHAIEFNARTSIAKVAKQVRLSKEVTNYHIRKLEKSGVIDCYRTMFNLFNLGKDYYVLLFKIKDYHSLEHEILEYMQNINRRSRIMICDGAWNLILTIRANSIQQLIEDISGFLDRYGAHIENRQILLTKEMFISKSYFIYPNIKKNPQEVLNVRKNLKSVPPLNKIEHDISLKLAVSPKFSMNSLANDLEIDVKTLKKYLARMARDGFIICHRTYVNAEKLGFKRFIVFLSFKNLSKNNMQVIEALKSSRNVPVIYTCFGMADLVFEMVVSDIDQLFQFLKHLSIDFSDQIKEYNFLPIVMYERKPD